MAFASDWMKKDPEEEEDKDSLSAVVSSPPRGPLLPGGYRLPSIQHPLGLGAVPRHFPPVVPLAPPAIAAPVVQAGPPAAPLLPAVLPPVLPAACPAPPTIPRGPFLCHLTREGLRCSCNRFVAGIFALVCTAVISVGAYGSIISSFRFLILYFQVFL